MVFLNATVFAAKTIKKSKRSILDSLRIYVKGGGGGFGLKKYGGKGGSGGDVVIVGSPDASLKQILSKNSSKRFIAGHGEDSTPKRILALKGTDCKIQVPLGITVYDDTKTKIGEINKEGEELVVANGGIGGCEETNYDASAAVGKSVLLDLKLIADVGLVGFPNAGKSTLLSILSNAKPKIASYPFTTIEPNLGVIDYEDLRKITIADLPGLIEGAHVNIGMGFRFLKHVERTKVMLMVVDITGFRLSPRHTLRSCLETIIILNKELELYKEELLSKPAILVVNKLDLSSRDEFQKIEKSLRNFPETFGILPEEYRPKVPINFKTILGMSAAEKNADEIDELKQCLRVTIDECIKDDVESEAELAEKIDRYYKPHGISYM